MASGQQAPSGQQPPPGTTVAPQQAPAPPGTQALPSAAPPPQAGPASPVVRTAQPVTVVQFVERPTRETSVGDILLGSVGFVGFALLAAFVVGILAGGLFIVVKRLRPDNAFNGQTADESSLKLNSL